jgi:hypothetical protein
MDVSLRSTVLLSPALGAMARQTRRTFAQRHPKEPQCLANALDPIEAVSWASLCRDVHCARFLP